MSLEIHEVFYTETMVDILRQQGSKQKAMELAKKILEKNPQHDGVKKILDELEEEARLAFERFVNSGRADSNPPQND